MAESLNLFLLDGNLTKDPVLEFTPNGTAAASYTVAQSRSVRQGDAREVETTYIPMTSYGRQAENDAKYLRRGSAVFIKCEVRSWRNAETGKSGFKFVAQSVRYLGQPGGQPKVEGGTAVDTADEAADDAWLRAYDETNPNGR